jgi:hypothetical protein
MGSIERIRREFERAVPRIWLHAVIVFRAVACPHRREDYIAEAIALSWKWWLRLRKRGKNPRAFVSAIATFAARAARSGRRLCGKERSKDALSPLAQQRHDFAVRSLPSVSTLDSTPFSEALADNMRTPPDEQAAFRLDFPAWLQTYDERRQRIIEAMATGERTQDLAAQFQISPGRISQLRREFQVGWLLFIGEC